MRKSKNPYFTTFLFPLGTPLGNHAKCCMDGKWIRCWQIVSQHVPTTYLSSTVSQLFEPQVQKIAIFTYRSPHFCFPWRPPTIITQCVPFVERQFNACKTPRSMYLSVFNSFRVIRCLSQSINQKNRYFYHIFISPGDAPGAITLNVIWMESEFDAYKLSRCMCWSNYYCFWDTARYLWKNRHFIISPLHSTPPLGGFPSEYRHPLWDWKTRMYYPTVRKFRRYL